MHPFQFRHHAEQTEPEVAINAVTREGYTALHLAAMNDNMNCTKLLLKRGAVNEHVKVG